MDIVLPFTVLPGDVMVIADNHFTSWFIRLQARLMGKPALHNHVAIFSHVDEGGTGWVIEGRPSGTGWEKADKYLKHPRTITNAAQPKTDAQRAALVAGARTMVGTEYDWAAIAELGAEIFRINQLWRRYREWGEGNSPPVHVICSSLLDWLYEQQRLANPGGDLCTRFTDVADWVTFIRRKEWHT